MRSPAWILTLIVGLQPVVALGGSGELVVTAESDGSETTLRLVVCLCLSTAEWQDYVASGQGEIEVTIGGAIEVTENDIVDDDELGDDGGSHGGGTWTPSVGTGGQGCPPANKTCVGLGEGEDGESGSMGPVDDDDYEDEDPADFQLGEDGEGEGTVPAGTSIWVPGVGNVSVSMPSRVTDF